MEVVANEIRMLCAQFGEVVKLTNKQNQTTNVKIVGKKTQIMQGH